mmetsp:Transcript_5795/g.18599  ORF Transcript_5795/g.18599 Transcript_5795/m.18599 type:complete len:258 (-) Transcript_5795:262-1035(-)
MQQPEKGQHNIVKEANLRSGGPRPLPVHEKGDWHPRRELPVALEEELLLKQPHPTHVRVPLQSQVAQVRALHGDPQQEHRLLGVLGHEVRCSVALLAGGARLPDARVQQLGEGADYAVVVGHISGDHKVDCKATHAPEAARRQIRKEVALRPHQHRERRRHVVVLVGVLVIITNRTLVARFHQKVVVETHVLEVVDGSRQQAGHPLETAESGALRLPLAVLAARVSLLGRLHQFAMFQQCMHCMQDRCSMCPVVVRV